MFNVLVTSRTFGTVTPDFDYFLERGYEVVKSPFEGRIPTEDELCAVVGDVDAILPGNDHITEKVISHAKKLKVISRPGIGVDNVDVEACSKRGIAVTNVPGITAVPVAELTMAMMLNISKLVMYTNRRVMSGMWPVDQGHDLYRKKLGIIGFGRIGQQVAKRAKAFEMEVMAYDPFMNEAKALELDVQCATLDEITEQCDYISLHIPKTPENLNLFDAARIARMKEGSYLINCSRGGLVDEDALYTALMSGHLAGAAADVLAVEPPVERPKLYDCDNFLITSHSGGNSKECIAATARVAADNLIAVLEHLPCAHIVNEKNLNR